MIIGSIRVCGCWYARVCLRVLEWRTQSCPNQGSTVHLPTDIPLTGLMTSTRDGECDYHSNDDDDDDGDDINFSHFPAYSSSRAALPGALGARPSYYPSAPTFADYTSPPHNVDPKLFLPLHQDQLNT